MVGVITPGLDRFGECSFSIRKAGASMASFRPPAQPGKRFPEDCVAGCLRQVLNSITNISCSLSKERSEPPTDATLSLPTFISLLAAVAVTPVRSMLLPCRVIPYRDVYFERFFVAPGALQ